jgi:hypothetical protein
MKKIAILIAALALSGCAELQKIKNAAEVVGEYRVSPTAVVVASNAFDAVEVTATNYLNLPRCKKVRITVVCRDPTASALIIPAVRSGRVARNNLQQFMISHPNQLGPGGVYDALTSAIDTINSVLAQYGAK